MRRVARLAPTAVVLALALALALAAGPATAAPSIDIMARTDILLDPVVRGYGGVVVSGQVVDRFSGEGVPGAGVVVTFNGERALANADGDGRFQYVFAAIEGTYDVRVDFPGSQAYSSAQTVLDDVDVGKSGLTLTVRAEASAAGATLVIRATSTSAGLSVPQEVPVQIAAGDAALGADKLTVVRSAQTGHDGFTRLSLDPALLGGPGRKRVSVRFAGDVAFNPSSAETTFDLTTTTTITMQLARTSIAFESALVATGRVVDAPGAAPDPAPAAGRAAGAPETGVPAAPVVLMVGARRLAETLTDRDGNFRFRVAGEEIGAGHHNVQALFEPSEVWRAASHTEVAAVDVAAPEPAPVSLTLLTFGATAAALLAFVGMRTRPWSAFTAKRKKADSPTGPERHRVEPSPGLVLARPGLVSTLRRAADDGFSGTVRDAHTHRPIPGAALLLELDGQDARLGDSGGDGSFGFEGLAHGEWRGRAAAPGYVTEGFAVAVPHRGELRGVRLDLLQVRERIFSMYRAAAQPLLPDADLWGIWTPRQIVDHVRSRRLDRGHSPSLATLTDFVEESYFSQRTPDEAVLEEASRLVEAAVREQEQVPPRGRFPAGGAS